MNIPLSRPLPATWTAAVDAAARAHTAESYPHEAAGIVGAGDYHRLDNISAQPGEDIALSDADLLRVAGADLFFHSHPDGLGVPSATDMIFQQQLAIPFVILVWPIPDLFAFGDQLLRAPLVGRGFRHGVHDCYALVRDWYADHGVDLWDQPRDWEWWTKGLDLYRDNFREAGFHVIEKDEATKPGDLLLFNFRSDVPMHAAIVTEPELLLHHASGISPVDRTRLSCPVPRYRYWRHATLALRHQRSFAP